MHGIEQNPLGNLPDSLLVRQAAPAAADDASHVLECDAAPPQTRGEELSEGRLPLAPLSEIPPTVLRELRIYPKHSIAGIPVLSCPLSVVLFYLAPNRLSQLCWAGIPDFQPFPAVVPSLTPGGRKP